MRTPLISCVGLVVAACVSANEGGSYARLNGAEIERLVDGTYVEYDTGAISLPFRVWREQYCSGQATSRGERVPIVTAPYSVVDDLLCVGLGNEQSCRAFYRRRDGHFYVQWLNSGSDAALERIQVAPLPTEACVN